MSDEINVCPGCGGSQIQRRTSDPYGAHDPDGVAWYCHDCRETFDTPTTRAAESHGRGGDFSDAYRALRDADPSDVGADP